MLDRRGDEVITRMQKAEDRGVIPFRASRVEHHFRIVTVEELRQRLTRLVHRAVGLLAVLVNR